MDIIEYIKEKITKVTAKRITFDEGGYCEKSPATLADWATKNYAMIFRDIKDEASKGPEYISSEIKKRYKELFPKQKKATLGEGHEIFTDERPLKYIHSLVPVADVKAQESKRGAKYLMLDPNDEYRISPVTYTAWENYQDPEYVKIIKAQMRPVVLKYMPTTIENFLPFEDRGAPIYYLNTYYPPIHRLEKIERPVVPKMISTFLRRLFVNTPCFEFMMESIFYMLNDRLQVIPVLNGGTGIGKGLFTEHLLGNLVGVGNSILAPKSWDKSGFNAWLLKKQLIVFDEAKIISNGPDANIDYLKRLMNDSLNVERKGIDADQLTDNHASFYITSNNGAKRFKLELDNRRFTPIDVTDVKVESIYTKEERDELVRLLDDPEVVANIYWEIQLNWNPAKRNPGRTPHTILQCQALYKFQYESLDIWQRSIAELILSKESDEYVAGEINANYRKVYTRITGRETNSKRAVDKADVKDFLQSYRHFGSDKAMGTVKEDEDGSMIIVAAKEYVSEHSGFKEVGYDSL